MYALLQDVAGDAIFLRSVLESRKKEWVRAMLVPYAVFFASACTASLMATFVKLCLFIKKWRARTGRGNGPGQTLGSMKISPDISGHDAVAALKDRFDLHRLEKYKLYSYLLLAAFEDIPLGTNPPDDSVAPPCQASRPITCDADTGAMNTIYIIRAMVECVEAFSSPKNEGVCDLDESTTLLLVFSTPALPTLPCAPVRTRAPQRLPGILTSAAMLGFKLAQIEILKLKLDEEKRLEQERANLIVELEAALSPEMARQVEDIVDRTRGSFMMPARAASLPKPAHIDAAKAEAMCGLVHEVRRGSDRCEPSRPTCHAVELSDLTLP